MVPTILIVGATGNTGRSVVEHLPELVKKSQYLSDHRILCLTRTINSDTAKQLAKLPGVEFAEKNWVDIDDTWLKEQNVERVFMASHNEPTQFAEEGQFYVYCLLAGIKYVVRISTTASNVRPDWIVYYPRSHWAIEMMLSQPEFQNLAFTSLQPDMFTPFVLASAAEFINTYRRTGEQIKLPLVAAADNYLTPIDPGEVGIIAAHLLAKDDFTPHNNKKYVLRGPENLMGNQIVKLVEEHIGITVDKEKVVFSDESVVEYLADQNPKMKALYKAFPSALTLVRDNKIECPPTSKEILDLYAPRRTPAQILADLVQE